MFDAPVASTSGYLYGFAFFRQKKDETIKRGYKQVLLCDCVVPAVCSDSSSWLLSSITSERLGIDLRPPLLWSLCAGDVTGGTHIL